MLGKDILSYVASYVGTLGMELTFGVKFEIVKSNYHHAKLNSQTVCPD